MRFALCAAGLATMSAVGCSNQECEYLDDCPSAQLCSADGRCVADERPFAGLREGGAGEGIGVGGAPNTGDSTITFFDVGESSATLQGDIGPVRGFDGAATLAYWEDFGAGWVNLTATNDAGAGLFILSLPAGFESLSPGTTTLRGGDDMNAPFVQLCSDNADAEIHFDGFAEEAIVTVTPVDDDPAVLDVEIEATITEGFGGEFSYEEPVPTVVRARFRL